MTEIPSKSANVEFKRACERHSPHSTVVLLHYEERVVGNYAQHGNRELLI